jgi:serine phosphatase RsbU (regulator of sigma subunit)
MTKRFLLFLLFIRICLLQAQSPDTSIARIDAIKADTTRIIALLNHSEDIRYSASDKAFASAEKALAIAEKTNRQSFAGRACLELAIILQYQNKLQDAMTYSNKALNHFEQVHDEKGEGRSHDQLSKILITLNRISESMDQSLLALHLFEGIKDLKGQANALRSMINLYLTQENYSKALEYGNRCVALDESAGELLHLAADYGNLGIIYSDTKQPQKALDYFLKGLKIEEEHNADKRELTFTMNNVGIGYDAVGNFAKALEYQQKVLKIRRDLKDDYGIAASLINIGSVYAELKEYKQAISYTQQGLDISMQNRFLEWIKESYNSFSQMYLEMGDYKNAYHYYTLYIEKRDSLLNANAKEELTRKEMNFEFDRKQQEEKLKREQEDALQHAELRRQKLIRNGSLAGLLLFLSLTGFIYRSYRIKQKTNFELEKRNAIIQQKNMDILDSINYAKTLQQSILPDLAEVRDPLSCFILYRPKDIVAGDFYWFQKKEENIFIAAADCTGHGVPGAFTSAICSQKLTEVLEKGVRKPGLILQEVDQEIRKVFRQQTQDGMDIALLKWNLKSGALSYSGANRPLLIIRNGEIIETKGDKASIGHSSLDARPFAQHELNPQKGDMIYLFSDGYADQFGGELNKKISTKRFKRFLAEAALLPVSEQETFLDKRLKSWRGNQEQIDDILVIGICYEG